MELEILQQILSEIKEVKQTVLKLELTIENEVKRDIKVVAENHLSLNQKLDELKGINERVLELKNDTDILKSITKDNLYDLHALKATK